MFSWGKKSPPPTENKILLKNKYPRAKAITEPGDFFYAYCSNFTSMDFLSGKNT